MTFVYETMVDRYDLLNADVQFNMPLKANDRRKIIRMLYGDWFTEQGLKLSRDYLLSLESYDTHVHRDRYPSTLSKLNVLITILDPKKAVLFKLRWGGS